MKPELFDPLFIYCFIGILAGARLGHCLFYQPDFFLSSWKHFVEIFLPIDFLPGGGWRFTGYRGLASHGGTLGLMLALWLYVRRTKMNIWQVLDNIAIATPLTACFIRLGNLMNSEIIGKITDVPWAFIFQQVDPVAGSISDTMAAFISYPQDKTDHTFSVYVNRPGLSFGYFFRGGGDIVEVDDYIAEFVVEGNNERAFISMNTQNIVRLEVDDGNGIQVIDIDSGKPFAIVLPLNVGNICFYDTNGNVVEYLRQQL